MRAINHALTGALIGLSIEQPLLAYPAALLSHFVCDMIPHYGAGKSDEHILKSKLFTQSLYADAMLCFLLVVLLVVTQPRHWLQAAICAFLAASPDFASINKFQKVRHNKQFKPNAYNTFAKNIQWFEKPIGAVVEVAWLLGASYLLSFFVR